MVRSCGKDEKEREVTRIYKWKPLASRPIGRPKNRWEDDVRKTCRQWRSSIGRVIGERLMEDNCWADQNSHRVVASIKKKKKMGKSVKRTPYFTRNSNINFITSGLAHYASVLCIICIQIGYAFI
jgi:hypothetical protein